MPARTRRKRRNLYGVDPTPQVAKVFQRALQERRFRYVPTPTATPIQNRLWTSIRWSTCCQAQGSRTSFGSEGLFARASFRQARDSARVKWGREELEIVYGSCRACDVARRSSISRAQIELHKVKRRRRTRIDRSHRQADQKLNRLAQIGILQALTSSPHALMAQLNTMARNGTVPLELAATVRAIVTPMKASASFKVLGSS